MMYTIIAKTVNEAWERAFDELTKIAVSGAEAAESRDGAVCAEILNAVIEVGDPTRNLVTSEKRSMPIRYAVGEFLWYLSKNNKLSAIQNFTQAWNRMSDDGICVNSNYGHCIHEKFGFDQWDMVKELLRRDPNSRQAVIHIKEARDIICCPTKDLNCTCTLQFFIRENKLYMTTYMRSNDVWMGLPYDMFAFTCLQMLMAMELDVRIGGYTHIAGSLHLYQRDFETFVSKGKALS